MQVAAQRRTQLLASLLAFAVAAATSTAGAQPRDVRKVIGPPPAPTLPNAPIECPLPAEHHPWAKFSTGAWRTLRTVTATFDENQEVLARTETVRTDTLLDKDNETYSIETSTVVEVGGRKLRSGKQTSRHSLISDATSEPPLVTLQPTGDISLGGRTIPCKRWELSFGEGAARTRETVYYSAEVYPYVLRRERSAADGSEELESTLTSHVVAVDVPLLMEEVIWPGCQLKINSTAGANVIERLELHSELAPGGLVTSTATERDASGNRVRWIVTELEDFGQAGERPQSNRRWRLFPGRRSANTSR